jgi:tRNA 2-selenouridine synthase
VLDLESIAHHKGSAFGDLGQEKQPTNEQFENNVYKALSQLDFNKPIWVEDESRSIGTVSIPDPFYLCMKQSPLIFMDVDRIVRIPKLADEYSGFDSGLIENAIFKISEKLGGLNTKLAKEALELKDFQKAIEIVLIYYDKAYLSSLEKKDQSKVSVMKVTSVYAHKNARKLLKLYKNEFNEKISF